MSATLDLTTAPLLTREDLETLIRIPALVHRALWAGWIKPVLNTGVERSGKELYTRAAADALVARLAAGEVPPVIERKAKGGQP